MHSPMRNRILLLVASVVLFATLLSLRLFDLQVRRSAQMRERASRQHHQTIEVDGQRGSIVDRAGRELAVSVTTQSLYAHPGRVKDPERTASLLSPVVGLPASKILGKLRSDRSFEWIARRLPPASAEAVRDLARRGVEIGRGKPLDFQEEPKRFYPQGALGVHVVGFADIDQRGVEGIEKQFDDVLRGDSARYLALRDGLGFNILQLVRPPTRLGQDVVLTLDTVLQHVVERELDRAMRETRARAATAILLDPRNGQVLAMANRPGPDPADYGSSPVEARRNRAVTDLYEPGSTFKAVTTAAALERGTVSPEQRFDCSPVSIGGHVYRDVHAHSVLSVREILEESSNNGIIRVGFTMPKDVFRAQIVRFGFGQRTGIGLPGERDGRVTPLARMSEQSRASMAMGYEVAATPLQVVAAIAAIANEGKLIPARVVLGTRAPDGTFTPAPVPEFSQVVSARTALTLAGLLEGVVVRGTGRAAAVAGYHIAGKTGTAKKITPGRGYADNEYFASFAAFGPLRKPRLAGLVVLDTPLGHVRYGGSTAAPALGRIMADALAYLGAPPDDDPWKARAEALEAKHAAPRKESSKRRPSNAEPAPGNRTIDDAAPIVIGPGQVPDLTGMTLRAAIAEVTSRGCRARVVGSGVVVRQNPAPGTPIEPGMACDIGLGEPPTPEPDPEPVTVARASPRKPAARPRAARRR